MLQKYLQGGHYTDCYSTRTKRAITHSQFVIAFYTTMLFRFERFILKWAVGKPSTDEEVEQLAGARRDSFAAWDVEGRADNQLLLSDYRGRTRSWLMVSPASGEQTRLYFGSAVVRHQDDDEKKPGLGFGLLLRFHKLYSIALLYCAKQRLELVT
ncbi:MAG: hypothetical protein K0U72_08375 [Gammaproteobacteria bacterium]|nr:hypothetical protein [Gammaproteobacteria bacterium]